MTEQISTNGFNNINWGNAITSIGVGAVTGYVGGKAGDWAFNKASDWFVKVASKGMPTSYSFGPWHKAVDETGNYFAREISGTLDEVVVTATQKASFSIGSQIGTTGASNAGKYSVYQGFDKATGAVSYIGITGRDATVRFGEHLRSNTAKSLLDYRVVPGTGSLSNMEAKIVEQTLINQHGLGNLLNVRNSIAPKYWNIHGIIP